MAGAETHQDQGDININPYADDNPIPDVHSLTKKTHSKIGD